MILVLDTNVWVSELALTSAIGSAVRFYLRVNNARIGLPEVIKLETEFHLRTSLNEHIENIWRSHRQLLAAFGRLKEVVLPKQDEVEQLIANVFSRLNVTIEEIPFTLESARKSLIRTVEKLPPSDKNQQFKDGVIWADCLKMLETESVFLVSNDKAFYKGHDLANSLADDLRRELHGFSKEFKIFPSLKELLSEIKVGAQISSEELVKAYMGIHGEKIENMATKHSFTLSNQNSVTIDIFVTEDPRTLFVNFTIEFECSDTTEEGRVGGRIIARGEGTYDSDTKRLVDLANRGEQMIYRLADGTDKKLENIVLLAGSIVIGHREIEHSVRYKL